MTMWKTKYCYTLKEVVDNFYSGTEPHSFNNPRSTFWEGIIDAYDSVSQTVGNYFNEYIGLNLSSLLENDRRKTQDGSIYLGYVDEITGIDDPNHTIALWQVIMNKYYDEIAVVCDEESPLYPMTDELKDKTRKLFGRIISIIIETKTKYVALINALEANKTTLMAGLSSSATSSGSTSQTGSSRYNDTPQGKFSNHNYEGDDYISEITMNDNIGSSSGSESRTWDDKTKVAKIREIEANLSDLYREWAKCFECLFIEGGNF